MATATLDRPLVWVDALKELPPLGKRVYVRGLYTPEGHGSPIAYRRTAQPGEGGERWESNEWRGTVSIWEWSEIPGTEGK